MAGISKQLLYLAAHVRLFCEERGGLKFKGIDFLNHLSQSTEVFIGSDRQQWKDKNALVIITGTTTDRAKIIRQRSSSFFTDLWKQNFITCQDLEKWTKDITSKIFQAKPLDDLVWIGVPRLTSHVNFSSILVSTE